MWTPVFLGIYLWVESLRHLITLCLTLWGAAKLFSRVSALFHFPTSNVGYCFLCQTMTSWREENLEQTLSHVKQLHRHLPRRICLGFCEVCLYYWLSCPILITWKVGRRCLPPSMLRPKDQRKDHILTLSPPLFLGVIFWGGAGDEGVYFYLFRFLSFCWGGRRRTNNFLKSGASLPFKNSAPKEPWCKTISNRGSHWEP